MKKLIGASVLFCLFSAAAFGQISVGGVVGAGTNLINGTLEKSDSVYAEDYHVLGSLQVDANNGTDTFGGSVEFSIDTRSGDTGYTALGFSATAWWKPILPLKLQIGTVEDFALSEITGWGYHANDAEDYVVSAPKSYAGGVLPGETGFFPGTGSEWNGLTLSVSPFYGLDINLAIPFGRGSQHLVTVVTGVDWWSDEPETETKMIRPQVKDVYLFSSIQAAYSVYGLGRFAVCFAGGGDGTLQPSEEGEQPSYYKTSLVGDYNAYSSTLYASFLWTGLKAMDINIGFGYPLAVVNDGRTMSYNPPMEAGLAVSYSFRKLGIKARFALSFLGSATRNTGATLDEPVRFGLGILPYYSFGPLTVYLNGSIAYQAKYKKEELDEYDILGYKEYPAAFGWYINPYITVTMGYGTFFAGFRLESDGLQKYRNDEGEFVYDTKLGTKSTDWAIPVGIQFSF